MRKLFSVLTAGLLAASLTVPVSAADTIKVWVADAAVSFTNEQIEAFKEANPDFAGYDYLV